MAEPAAALIAASEQERPLSTAEMEAELDAAAAQITDGFSVSEFVIEEPPKDAEAGATTFENPFSTDAQFDDIMGDLNGMMTGLDDLDNMFAFTTEN